MSSAEMGRPVAVVLYVVAMAAVIVGVDFVSAMARKDSNRSPSAHPAQPAFAVRPDAGAAGARSRARRGVGGATVPGGMEKCGYEAWERLAVNIGIVLVFAAFYLR
jgi:hypothetical protein